MKMLVTDTQDMRPGGMYPSADDDDDDGRMIIKVLIVTYIHILTQKTEDV